jgi:hypothetical protein
MVVDPEITLDYYGFASHSPKTSSKARFSALEWKKAVLSRKNPANLQNHPGESIRFGPLAFLLCITEKINFSSDHMRLQLIIAT